MSEPLSTQSPSQQLMPPQDARRSRYNSVLRLYLISGAAGLFIWIGFTLDDLGWLEPAIEFLFGGYADRILSFLYMLSVMVTFIFAFGMMILWIPAIIYCIRFWYSWRVVLPAALLLVAIVGFGFSFIVTDGEIEGVGMYLTLGGMGGCVISAFLIGLEWAKYGIRGFRS
jgi:hypothetical protein